MKKPFNPNQNRRPKRACPDIARDAAARLVWRVLEDGLTLDEVMNSEGTYADLHGRDRGFAAAIAKSTLRYLGHIDILLAQHLSKPLPDTAFYVRALLRTGVAQFLAELAPVHAIIDRAVELAKSDKVAFGMSGLINAVLRKVITAEKSPELAAATLLPNAWRARYLSTYGEENTAKIANSLLTPAPIDISLRADLVAPEREIIAKDFNGEFIAPLVLRIGALPENLLEIDSWKNGEVWVQDAAATLPVTILKPKKGEAILDMCAAPGGKTMQLASYWAQVTAIDLSEDRMRLVAENLTRTRLNAKLQVGDAKKLCGENKWDAILLDAPCSASGTLRRNLETLWIKTPYDLPKLIEIQGELIRAAAIALKPNGRLVYAICSMEPEEADLAVAAALECGLTLDPIKGAEVFGIEEAIEVRGTARILPYMLGDKGGLDGFFIARFVKN